MQRAAHGSTSECHPDQTVLVMAMGPTHCPLCMALMGLCLLRAGCHLTMIWQLTTVERSGTWTSAQIA